MSRYIIAGIISAAVLAGGLFAGILIDQHFAAKPLAGSFTPVQGLPFVVSKTVLPTDTTITLSSFKADGYPLTMSSFGAIAYGTLDPNNTARIESISFTGITQNSDGSATLTGVSRGLASTYPYAASTTLEQTHLVGSQFILSNTAAFYGQQFLFANQTGTSSAVLVFSSTTPPTYDLDPGAAAFAAAASSTLIDQAQLSRAILSGCSNGTSILQGCVQLATAKQAASSTVTGSTGANDVLASSYATDTPSTSGCATSGGCVVMSLLNGKLSQLWYDLTQAFTVTGLWTFNTKGITVNATTTIAASSTVADALVLDGVTYAWTASQGASSTAPENDGAGNISWEYPSMTATSSRAAVTVTNTSTSTIASFTVPAGRLGTSGGIQAIIPAYAFNETSGNFAFQVSYGTGYASVVCTQGASVGDGMIYVTLQNSGATNSQVVSISPVADHAVFSNCKSGPLTLSIDSTSAQIFTVSIRAETGSGNQVTIEPFVVSYF